MVKIADAKKTEAIVMIATATTLKTLGTKWRVSMLGQRINRNLLAAIQQKNESIYLFVFDFLHFDFEIFSMIHVLTKYK